MSMRSLESAICWEARQILENRTLRVKDIREWSTGPVKCKKDEIVIHISLYGVNVAVYAKMDKRGATAQGRS